MVGSAVTKKIGVSGNGGSFSEEAGRVYARDGGISDYQIVYLTDAEHVLSELEKAAIDVGIFAIENSNGGVVTEYLPAIARHRFTIEKIFEIPVDHMLLVRKGTHAADVTAIVSQKQALRQCRMYLQRHWPGVELKEYVDTATAARDLAEGALPNSAAVVASARAGELHGLEVLEAKIQDLKFNYTVFIAASKFKADAQ